jgi:hypothetical protein
MSYIRINGERVGTCACGCGTELFERLYLRPASRKVAFRTRPRFVRNHSLRVNHCDRTGATNAYPVAAARRAMALPLGPDLDATIVRRRRELGLSPAEMQQLLGWKGVNNLRRYKYKLNVMPRTLHAVLDRLFSDEGGWVEAEPIWRLARQRQALWGMTDREMALHLGCEPARWLGKATARRVLLALATPAVATQGTSDLNRRLKRADEKLDADFGLDLRTNAVRVLFAAGASVPATALRLGVSARTVQRTARKAGLSPKGSEPVAEGRAS